MSYSHIKRVRFNRRGLSLTEIAVSAAIIGGIGVMTLKGIATMNQSHLDAVDLGRSQLLARELMDEILQQNFGPSATDGVVGSSATTRAAFNSIGDYDGWNASGNLAPQLKDGTIIELGNGWTRSVQVDGLKPDEIVAASADDSGIALVTVVVARFEKQLARMRSIRSRSWRLTRSLDQIDE